MGLHGKSFIPLVMGFGCNVPAVMATRTIESRRSRLITMLVLPLMSCSARLPIYIMITGTFFAAHYRSLVMLSLYAVGILLAVVVSRVLSLFVIKEKILLSSWSCLLIGFLHGRLLDATLGKRASNT